MHSFVYLSVLLTSTFALPTPQTPTPQPVAGIYYSTGANAQLRPDLETKWYSLYNESTNVAPPSDPASFYSCAGPHITQYPTKEKWLSFEIMWKINAPRITEKNGGPTHNQQLKTAIEEISLESKVDARLILAIVMQETWGKVSESCSNHQATDCGIMQINGGYRAGEGDTTIKGMIADGIYGISAARKAPYGTPGFLTYFNAKRAELGWLEGVVPGEFWEGNPFAAGHAYNAGTLGSASLHFNDGATSPWYANDMVSRLLGWDGAREGCLRGHAECGLPERSCW